MAGDVQWVCGGFVLGVLAVVKSRGVIDQLLGVG